MNTEELKAKIQRYTNEYGQIKYTENEKQWSNNNPFLMSGQVALLSNELFGGILSQYTGFLKSIGATTAMYSGLNTRHAPVKEYLISDKFDSISLDEHDGIAFSSIGFGCRYQVFKIVRYGELNSWSYNEKDPNNEKPFSYINLINGLAKLLAFAIRNNDWSGSEAMDKVIFQYTELVRLSRIRLPKDRAFMRLIAYKKTSFFSYMHLCASLAYSAYKDKVSGHNRSYYRFLSLENMCINRFFLTFAHNYYKKRMYKRYGKHYLWGITDKQIWNKDHPLFDLIKELGL